MMDENVASIDECVSWLQQQVLDLLSLREVVTRLSTDWDQLKSSLRENGVLRGDESVEGLKSQPTSAGGDLEVADYESTDDNQASQSIKPTENGTGSTAVVFIGPVRPTDIVKSSSGTDESEQSVDQYEGQSQVTQTSGTESLVYQNGSMETSESATVQSSGLQMS